LARSTRVMRAKPNHLRCGSAFAWALVSVLSLGGCKEPPPVPAPLPPVAANELRAPEAFASIVNREQRARALFAEMHKVIGHPRCSNCHPAGDTPFQGDAGRIHDPPVVRGPANEGVPALYCGSCHQDQNLELARVPGAPHWKLAPREMAWVGKSPRAICEQLKDRGRNGGKSLEQIIEHVSHDALVGWGWAPGHDRKPAPGNQARFGELTRAWVSAGASCPESDER
jgi:hypothetical protein